MAFNELKATQIAAHLLRLRGGRMSYMKLIKLMYLADRSSLLARGRAISTDRYVSMDRGPVLSQVLDLVNDGDLPNQPQIWSAYISKPLGDYEIEVKAENPGRDELSDREIGILNETFAAYGTRGRWELVDFCHLLPEWQNPDGGSIPIQLRDIFIPEGKTDRETKVVEDDLAELNRADFLFRR